MLKQISVYRWKETGNKVENDISDIVFVKIKWKTIKNNITGDKELNLNCYVLEFMLVTRDTAHFERSRLNTDAS